VNHRRAGHMKTCFLHPCGQWCVGNASDTKMGHVVRCGAEPRPRFLYGFGARSTPHPGHGFLMGFPSSTIVVDVAGLAPAQRELPRIPPTL
jgi:hypothetical protein